MKMKVVMWLPGRKEEQEKLRPRDFKWEVSGTAHHKPPTGLRVALVCGYLVLRII
jgi:hypothetical protein